MTEVATQLELQTLVARFANSFDLKDWVALGDCLADSLYADYSELRGTPAETLTRAQFIEPRQAALKELKTHHLAGNVEMKVDGARADLKVSMAVFIQRPDGERIQSHCVYFMGVAREEAGWRIQSITQKVLIK